MIQPFYSSPFMLHPVVLVMAGLLDAAIGDPAWLPHPVRLMGSSISGAEKFLRKFSATPRAERWAGVLLVIVVVVPAFLIASLINVVIFRVGVFGADHILLAAMGVAVLVYLCSTTIAARELVRAARQVMGEVNRGDLAAARRSLGMIVGRDTDSLSEKDILKATMETLAENLSDGIVAPLFYLSVGGLPLAMAYKAVNTLDSMVGYKNDRYRYFGWASARLDDAANFIPARITGLLIVIASTVVLRSFSAGGRAWRIMLRDGGNHTSPNSGIPEAAMAGAVGIRMGGPSTYGGRVVEKPYIGDMRNDNYRDAAVRTLYLVQASSLPAFVCGAVILYMRIGG